jgi:uridine kinase
LPLRNCSIVDEDSVPFGGHTTMEERKAFIIGISGCSSSGKTTLARLLRDIFPDSFILHEDDFYKPEEE